MLGNYNLNVQGNETKTVEGTTTHNTTGSTTITRKYNRFKC